TVLGLIALVLGLFIILWWAPMDSDTGLAEKIRGRWSAGDALAPTVAGAVIALSGIGITIAGWGRETFGLSLRNLGYLAQLVVVLLLTFAVMRWAGPLVADALGAEYRPLRDEVPWKYFGFVLGGGGMIFALMTLIEGRFRGRLLALALVIALTLALIYDLPFEDLLMPPNGDV
ncbi:MAG: hypothetical protein AAF401_01680, partial [Pseudomonadota bacterium]